MNYEKLIVCLANSKKPGGRCVAGCETARPEKNRWIRPVSVRPSAEISLDERRYEDGTEPRLLDVIRIPMIAPAPHLHQTENHLIDADYYWTKERTLAWKDLSSLAESPNSLWLNGDSTYHGQNDRIKQSDAAELKRSLYLIRPKQVTVRVLTPGADFGNPKRAVRADFHFNDRQYDLKVTDLEIEHLFLAKQNGTYEISQDTFFTVSLAEAHTDGYCYKLVAAIFSEHSL